MRFTYTVRFQSAICYTCMYSVAMSVVKHSHKAVFTLRASRSQRRLTCCMCEYLVNTLLSCYRALTAFDDFDVTVYVYAVDTLLKYTAIYHQPSGGEIYPEQGKARLKARREPTWSNN